MPTARIDGRFGFVRILDIQRGAAIRAPSSFRVISRKLLYHFNKLPYYKVTIILPNGEVLIYQPVQLTDKIVRTPHFIGFSSTELSIKGYHDGGPFVSLDAIRSSVSRLNVAPLNGHDGIGVRAALGGDASGDSNAVVPVDVDCAQRKSTFTVTDEGFIHALNGSERGTTSKPDNKEAILAAILLWLLL